MNTSSAVTLFHEDVHIFDNPYIRFSLIVMYTVVFIFCFVGNLMVVLVTSWHRRMRSVTKISLGNLAFSNLCVGIFCIYQNLSMYLFSGWLFGVFLCKMYHFINGLSHTASILILVVNAVERYLVILYPFHARRYLTKTKLKLIIIAVWLLSGGICSPRLYYMHLIQRQILDKDQRPLTYLICAGYTTRFDFPTWDVVHFVLLFLLPLLTITTLYTKLCLYLKEQIRTRDALVETPLRETICKYAGNNRVQTDALGPSQRESRNYPLGPNANNANGTSNYIPVLCECRACTDSSQCTTAEAEGIEPMQCLGHCECVASRGLVSCRWSVKRESKILRQPHKTVMKLLIAIVVTFFVCNLPYHVRKMYQNYATDPDLESNFSELCTPLSFLMMYVQCAVNPFIYGFMSKTFRICMLEFIHCRPNN